MTKPKRPPGRPPVYEYIMPDPIPDSPENIALACMQGPPPPKEDWDYLKPVRVRGKEDES